MSSSVRTTEGGCGDCAAVRGDVVVVVLFPSLIVVVVLLVVEVLLLSSFLLMLMQLLRLPLLLLLQLLLLLLAEGNGVKVASGVQSCVHFGTPDYRRFWLLQYLRLHLEFQTFKAFIIALFARIRLGMGFPKAIALW
jgi:hypothetical protein